MPDTLFIQLLAVILFAACLFHSWRTEGPRAAQQWFISGYIFAFLFITVIAGFPDIAVITFSSSMLFVGAAPSLTIMLLPALFYLAYTMARQFADSDDLRRMAYLVFLLTAALMLPFEAVALQQGWWTYPTTVFTFLDGVPFYMPFLWGAAGMTFIVLVGRIRRIRLRGNGQFYAMILAIPIATVILFLLLALLQVLELLIERQSVILAYALLALILVILPIALLFNLPRIPRPQPTAND
jgi:hypothetical protein